MCKGTRYKHMLCGENLQHGASGFTSPLKEVVLQIFIALKNHHSWLGFNLQTLGPVASVITYTTENNFYKGTRSTVTLRFCSNFAIWQWTPPDFIAKILGVYSQQLAFNTLIFQFLPCELTSLTKVLFFMSFTVRRLVACWSVVRATRVQFPLVLSSF
jgi:hypothetical protein